MNYSWLTSLFILLVFLCGCTPDNPKTLNERLRNKVISWSDGQASSYEFLADGSLIAIGGDFPTEGYGGGIWESVSEDGSFKIVMDPAEPDIFHIARMQTALAQGTTFLFEAYTDGQLTSSSTKSYTIISYGDVTNTHKASAIKARASAYITRYANDLYTLDLIVEDRNSKIKKIFTEGDMIHTEVMVTNAHKWRNNPPIILSEEWQSAKNLKTIMTIHYHDGTIEKGTFLSSGFRDKSILVFDDAWF